MGVMDIFRNVLGQPATPAPAPMQPAPMQNGLPVTPTVPSNPNNPTAPQDTNNKKTPDAPLAKYAELWKNDPNNKPADPNAPLFAVDPQAVLKAAQGIDFKGFVTPELAVRIQVGGEDGMKATMEAMNAVAQNAFAQSAITSSKVAEEAAKKAVENITKQIPSIIKQHTARDAFFEENAALNDPTLKPLVTSIQGRLQTKFPEANAAQLQVMTNEILENMADRIVAGKAEKNPPKQTAKGNRDQDWSKFLE